MAARERTPGSSSGRRFGVFSGKMFNIPQTKHDIYHSSKATYRKELSSWWGRKRLNLLLFNHTHTHTQYHLSTGSTHLHHIHYQLTSGSTFRRSSTWTSCCFTTTSSFRVYVLIKSSMHTFVQPVCSTSPSRKHHIY